MSENKIHHLLTSNWVSKLLSLLIAIAVWFTIFSHLSKQNPKTTPVPGTQTQIPIPQSPSDVTPQNPLMSPPPAPSTIPGTQ